MHSHAEHGNEKKRNSIKRQYLPSPFSRPVAVSVNRGQSPWTGDWVIPPQDAAVSRPRLTLTATD